MSSKLRQIFFRKDAISFQLNNFLYHPGNPPGMPPGMPPGNPPSYLPNHLPDYLPSYPPGNHPSSNLMLPNLTNQFIKLSDGDLQCE